MIMLLLLILKEKYYPYNVFVMILWFALHKAYGWHNIWYVVTELAMFTAIGWGTAAKNHFNVTLKLRVAGAVHLHLLYAFMAWTRTALHLTFCLCA